MRTLIRFATLLPLVTLALTAAPTGAHATRVDGHMHFLSPGGENNPRWVTYSKIIFRERVYAGADQALKEMKAGAVEKAVAISAAYYFIDEADAIKENDFAAGEVAKHPAVHRATKLSVRLAPTMAKR